MNTFILDDLQIVLHDQDHARFSQLNWTEFLFYDSPQQALQDLLIERFSLSWDHLVNNQKAFLYQLHSLNVDDLSQRISFQTLH